MREAVYRTTKFGITVVYGEASRVVAGRTIRVRKDDGNINLVEIKSVGRPFDVGGVAMVYGYLTESPSPRRGGGGRGSYRRRRKSCPSGGNCSSFGDGRSCGAPDCDGW